MQKLTFKPEPVGEASKASTQIDLFASASSDWTHQVHAYLSALDDEVVQADTVRIIGTFQFTEAPEQAGIVLLTGKEKETQRNLFRLSSNILEVDDLSRNWQHSAGIMLELQSLELKLAELGQPFTYEFDMMFIDLKNDEAIKSKHTTSAGSAAEAEEQGEDKSHHSRKLR